MKLLLSIIASRIINPQTALKFDPVRSTIARRVMSSDALAEIIVEIILIKMLITLTC